MTEYKRLQIIKHALQKYLERPDATSKEIEEEKRLLKKVTDKVEELKQEYSIN
ncbi:hypothetical protein [Bacillus sp. ISL-57]|uniref:hypothetical protein n=1 Tax=Bacillus sp. ISL-57 TaxID=2819135 RepID=UPI001BE6DA03|nr:hypothetical protein [Bacillus sp. ISL-57]MBT2718287.1 hypothetical protein [Bacillus sp. ISL-57]